MKRKAWLPIIFLVIVLAAVLLHLQFNQTQQPPSSLTEAPTPSVEQLTWDQLVESLADKPSEEIRQHGVRFFQAGDPDKAFLLFKQAAGKGDSWSAMVIGEMYDPATFAAKDFDQKLTAFSKANPRKALQWYGQALQQGETQAQPLYDRLIAYLQQAAAEGDASAQRLLKRVER